MLLVFGSEFFVELSGQGKDYLPINQGRVNKHNQIFLKSLLMSPFQTLLLEPKWFLLSPLTQNSSVLPLITWILISFCSLSCFLFAGSAPPKSLMDSRLVIWQRFLVFLLDNLIWHYNEVEKTWALQSDILGFKSWLSH